MTNISYMSDYTPGIKAYCPEMGDREPAAKMRARLSWYGKHYYVDSPVELKGRGIVEEAANWREGTREAVEGWKVYKVTEKAFEKLQTQYPIAMAMYLD